MELECRVMRQDRIRRQLGGHQIEIDGMGTRVGSWRDDGIQPAPHPDDSTGFGVVGQQRFLPPGPDLASGGEMGGQLCSGENRMPPEERLIFHDGLVDLLALSQVLLWYRRSIVNEPVGPLL